MQTARGSAWEAVTNVLVGYGISFTANAVFLPMLGVPISVRTNLIFGVIMTAVSFVRSFALRRVFNRWKRFEK